MTTPNKTLETNADSASLRRHRSAFRSVQTVGYISCLVIALLCGCTTPPSGIGRGAVVVSRTSDATNSLVTLPSSFRRVGAMQIQWDDGESKRWQSGCHRLFIYDRDMQEITSEVFRCHYGMNADAVDLDGDSVPEFVALLHLGPAVGPAIRELRILRLNGSFLEEVARVPLAGQAGPSQGWWYAIRYEREPSAEVTVRLALHHDPLGEWAPFLPKTRHYRIAVQSHEARVLSDSDKAPNQTVQRT